MRLERSASHVFFESDLVVYPAIYLRYEAAVFMLMLGQLYFCVIVARHHEHGAVGAFQDIIRDGADE